MIRNIWAVIPVKCFSHGKSRLSAVLDEAGRTALAREMFEHVLSATMSSAQIVGTLVITGCPRVVDAAERRGAHVMREPAGARLGLVIDAGLAETAKQRADGGLVLMSDLPELTSGDLDSMIDLLQDVDLVVAPDQRDEGTNAIALKHLEGAQSCFGHVDSFSRHLAKAHRDGQRVAVFRSKGLGLDVDTPEDWRQANDRSAVA